MSYVRTAGMSTAARRRRRRTAMVLTALVTLLAVVLVYSFAYYQGWLASDDDAAQPSGDMVTTSAPPGEAELQPADVLVNVYNGTQRAGLASTTAEALATYGFTIDAISNDPERASVSLVDIRYGPQGEEGAQLLSEVFPEATLVPDTREGAQVDVVLGRNFTELLPEGEEPEGD